MSEHLWVKGPFLTSLLQGLWNTLPPDTRNSLSVSTFRSKLKTHLFKLASPLEFSPILSSDCLPGFDSCFSFTFSPIEKDNDVLPNHFVNAPSPSGITNNHYIQSCPRVTFFGPDPTRRNVDPTDPTRPAIANKSLTLPDPTPSYAICIMSSKFKNDLDWFYFQDRSLDATKRLGISDVSKVNSRFNLSRYKLSSPEQFSSCKVQADQRH